MKKSLLFIVLVSLICCQNKNNNINNYLYFDTYDEYREYDRDYHREYYRNNKNITCYQFWNFVPENATKIYHCCYNDERGGFWFFLRYNYSNDKIDQMNKRYFYSDKKKWFYNYLNSMIDRGHPIPEWFIKIEDLDKKIYKYYLFKDIPIVVDEESKVIYAF